MYDTDPEVLMVKSTRVSLTQDFTAGPIEVYGDDLSRFLGIIREMDDGTWEAHGDNVYSECQNKIDAIGFLVENA